MKAPSSDIEVVRAAIISSLVEGSIRAEDVAQCVGTTQRTMQRRLAAHGMTFAKLLAHVRHEAAHSMLRHTDLPLTEIAESLGYTSLSNFSRAFRRWSNVSPGVYRARARREEW